MMRTKNAVVAAAVVVVGWLLALPARAAFPPDVLALMDTTIDPCEDFYQYACGGWTQNYTLPADQEAYALSFDGLEERSARVIQEIIQDDWPLIGELYDSCMALDRLSAMGNTPLQRDLARINSAATKTDLLRVVGALRPVSCSLVTDVTVAPHINDTSRNVLYVGYADTVLPDPQLYLNDGAFAKIEPAFREYILTAMTLVGMDMIGSTSHSSNGEEGIADVVIAIEKRLAAILPRKQDPAGYRSLSYTQAAAMYPLTFQAMTEGFQLLETSSFTNESSVVIFSLAFMDRAEKLVQSLELAHLKVYYSFLYVNALAPYLGDDFVQANFDFFGKALEGQATRSKREVVCASAQIAFFPDLMGNYFFLKLFDVERSQHVQLMVDALEQAMAQRIASLPWLDESTREQAENKLAKLSNLIGRSTEKLNYAFVLSREDYFHNVHMIKMQAWNKAMAEIDQPVDRFEWAVSATSVNAYYAPWANQIVLPAGILQSPFYSAVAHPAQNFGAIGAVIGHELTHGFDPSGRHFDGDGNQREWWTTSTAKEFESRAACLRDQYSTMLAYGDSGKPIGYVDGNRTVAENIADNGGVGIALDAYHVWTKRGATFDRSGEDNVETEQLFFVSFAQIWCGRIRDGAQKKLLATDGHAPKPVRVNGVAMNSEQFATAFQCVADSKMNPSKKCQLW